VASGKPADANCLRSHLAEVPSDAGADTPSQIVEHSSADRTSSDPIAPRDRFQEDDRRRYRSRSVDVTHNVYRFFPSKQAIDEAAVADLFEQVSAAGTLAVRGGSALERLTAALRALSQLHEHRLENDSKQHELVAAAVRENWAVALSYADRIRGIVCGIIAAGQASGELRQGSPMAMTWCLLEAMDGYLSPSRINAATVRPTFDKMMDFCAGALRQAPWRQSIDLAADLRPKAMAQG
jgi:AcrR family transcriptional regulator